MKKYFIFLCLSFIFVFSCKQKAENQIENQFSLSFIVNSRMGELSVTLDDKTLESKSLVTAGKIVSFKAIAKDGFSVDYWQINEKKEYINQDEMSLKIEKDTIVVLFFKTNPKKYQLTYSFNNKEGSVVAEENGRNIESGVFLEEGTLVKFEAIAKDDYYVSGWMLNDIPINDLNSSYKLKISKDSHIKVNFSKKIKEDIQLKKIVIGKIEYLNATTDNEKDLKLLENGKEEVVISEDNLDIIIYIEKPNDAQAKLIIDDGTEEKLTKELKGDSIFFERKGIAITEDFKTFKINLSKDGYNEKYYSFKAKKQAKPIIPKNVRIRKLFSNYRDGKPSECIKPSDDGLEYNVEFPAKVANQFFYVWILGEKEDAIFFFKEQQGSLYSVTDGKAKFSFGPLPDKNQTRTFVIVVKYKDEKFEYKVNFHIKGE